MCAQPRMETSRRAAKRQRILTAALDVFRRGGFRDANVSDIALVAGVGKGTIYEYYKSKDDLFLDVCRMMVGTATERALRPEVMALPPALRLMAMLDGLLAQHAGFTDTFPLMIEYWAHASTGADTMRARLHEMFRPMYDDWIAMFRQLVDDCVEAGEMPRQAAADGEALALGMGALFDGLIVQAVFIGQRELIPMLRRFVRITLRGVLTDPDRVFAEYAAMPPIEGDGPDDSADPG